MTAHGAAHGSMAATGPMSMKTFAKRNKNGCRLSLASIFPLLLVAEVCPVRRRQLFRPIADGLQHAAYHFGEASGRGSGR